LELYDNNGKLLDEQEIGNDAKLTHGQESLEYRGCGWMVIRIVPYHPPPINPRDFSALTYPGDPNLPREENLDRRPHPNPVEAFVTLPWFIRWDGKRKGVGVIDDDSKQLVHVHFIETVNSSQGYPVAIIPLIKGSQHQGFDVKKLAKKSVLDSYTTICFRTMFSNPPESSEYYSEDEVAPGTKWWVERPSRMKK
jgi:hypothetical protein